MDSLTTARRIADPIGSLGARFMLDRSTFDRCVELGLPDGMAGYVQGRLGVMGDVSADEAADAAYFFDRFREMVARHKAGESVTGAQIARGA